MPIELQSSPATAPAVTAEKSAPVARRPVFGAKAPGARDRMAFTEQLALLLETDMPLHTALQSIGQQSASPAMQAIIADLVAEVETGQRFAAALEKHPELFSSTYVNLVAASEGSGFLPKFFAVDPQSLDDPLFSHRVRWNNRAGEECRCRIQPGSAARRNRRGERYYRQRHPLLFAQAG